MTTLGPSLGDIYEDLMASNDVADTSVYRYIREDGSIYAVGDFGRARVTIGLELQR